MEVKMNHNSDGITGIFGMIATVVSAFIARFNITLSDLSAVFAMIAAAATATYYIAKTVMLIKKKR